MVNIINMTLSANKDKPLPSFKKPPLIEVVLSVQFEPLIKLQASQVGLLWSSKYRNKYPRTEQHPKINAVTERFGIPEQSNRELRIEFGDGTDTPRCWFVKEDESELIQIQQDCFLHNWRKRKKEDYPRYEPILKGFCSDLDEFYSFVDKEKLGSIVPNQCEINYINHIPVDDVWKDHSELNKITPRWQSNCSDDFLGEPENTQLKTQYIFNTPDGEPWGRLYINLQPAFRNIDKKAIYVLTMTVRGRPLTPDRDGIINFLNHGREMIVRGFASVTSKEMHVVWERNDVGE